MRKFTKKIKNNSGGFNFELIEEVAPVLVISYTGVRIEIMSEY